MSFTGPAPNINLNEANLVLTDSSKRIKTPKVEITTYDSTGVSITKLDATTLNIQGNVFMGSNTITANASNMVSTTDVADGSYGGASSIPTITIQDGRVSTISTTAVAAATLQGVTGADPTTTNGITISNTTSIITTGKVGVANSAPVHQLDIGTNVYADYGTLAATEFVGDGGLLGIFPLFIE